MKAKPQTESEWAAYRCQASCKMGREALDDANGTNQRPVNEYAMYNLLHAVEDLSKQVELSSKTKELP